MRHRRRGNVIATREGAVGLRPARGQHVIGWPRGRVARLLADGDIVEPAAGGSRGRRPQFQLDRLDAASFQFAQPDRLVRPLLRIQRLRLRLRGGADAHTMIVVQGQA